MQITTYFEGVAYNIPGCFGRFNLDSILSDLLMTPRNGNDMSRHLRFAAHLGEIKCVNALIDAGANQHDKYNGATALIYAVRSGKVDCVSALAIGATQEELNDALIEARSSRKRPRCIEILYTRIKCFDQLAKNTNYVESYTSAIRNGALKITHDSLIQWIFLSLNSMALQMAYPSIITLLQNLKPSLPSTVLLLKNHRLFKQHENSLLNDNRHNDTNLQYEDDHIDSNNGIDGNTLISKN